MIDRQKCAVEAGMVSRSSAPSSGGSLPSVRHLTHHPYTAEDSIQPDGRNCKENYCTDMRKIVKPSAKSFL